MEMQPQDSSSKKINWKLAFIAIAITIFQVISFFFGFMFLIINGIDTVDSTLSIMGVVILGIAVILPFIFLRYVRKKTGSFRILKLNFAISIFFTLFIIFGLFFR